MDFDDIKMIVLAVIILAIGFIMIMAFTGNIHIGDFIKRLFNLY